MSESIGIDSILGGDATRGCNAIVKRPDHYIFGAGRSLGDLPGLMSDLRDQLWTGRTDRGA